MNYNFDGHKLFYNFKTTCDILLDKIVNPVYIEYSPVGNCNHRCIFCAYDYIGYKHRQLNRETTVASIRDFAKIGVKAMLFAGEGEPLLHPDISAFITTAFGSGVDTGIYTNGVLFDQKRIKEIFDKLTFVRISFNAGSREVYRKVHKKDDFDKVIKNIKFAVDFKRKKNVKADIGLQFVVIPENLDSLLKLSELGRELGIDYLAVKPFVQHNSQRGYEFRHNYSLSDIELVLNEAESFSTESYKVIARKESFRKYHERTYDHCLALPLFGVVLSDGNVYACGPYLGDERFHYGNIDEKSIIQIYRGKKRNDIIKFAKTDLNCRKNCMPNCRLDAINRSLWELKHPTVKHINFI
ncbi:MAG: radical SAM protein [Candidatus Acidulodesulfobacterium ferriphilum]|uniref:Radical SAM protein n=1 Tax=Candidatus Acidulodesulfobacterium ferriphilum TaxID=2597223 RepID=A0A519BAE3_9DELT|nr:MAG: radical SAM protein [Candidatus Acidulodesulfobacterium ferriphilum]